MGRFKTLPPRLKSLPPRIGLPKAETRQEQEVERLRLRDRDVKWRAWYKTARWQQVRQAVFVRDSYICQRTGVICAGKHPADDSPVAHHKVRHQGDEVLFWDVDNVETVSKAWHDGPGQAEERQAEGGW